MKKTQDKESKRIIRKLKKQLHVDTIRAIQNAPNAIPWPKEVDKGLFN
jgi:hypothetical protein